MIPKTKRKLSSWVERRLQRPKNTIVCQPPPILEEARPNDWVIKCFAESSANKDAVDEKPISAIYSSLKAALASSRAEEKELISQNRKLRTRVKRHQKESTHEKQQQNHVSVQTGKNGSVIASASVIVMDAVQLQRLRETEFWIGNSDRQKHPTTGRKLARDINEPTEANQNLEQQQHRRDNRPAWMARPDDGTLTTGTTPNASVLQQPLITFAPCESLMPAPPSNSLDPRSWMGTPHGWPPLHPQHSTIHPPRVGANNSDINEARTADEDVIHQENEEQVSVDDAHSTGSWVVPAAMGGAIDVAREAEAAVTRAAGADATAEVVSPTPSTSLKVATRGAMGAATGAAMEMVTEPATGMAGEQSSGPQVMRAAMVAVTGAVGATVAVAAVGAAGATGEAYPDYYQGLSRQQRNNWRTRHPNIRPPRITNDADNDIHEARTADDEVIKQKGEKEQVSMDEAYSTDTLAPAMLLPPPPPLRYGWPPPPQQHTPLSLREALDSTPGAPATTCVVDTSTTNDKRYPAIISDTNIRTLAQEVADANRLHCPPRTPLPIKLPSHLSLGSLATVTGLVAASEKNGLTVKILGYDEKAGRHQVEFTVAGNTALLRSQNLAQHEDLMATDLLHTSAVSTSKPKTDKISENARDSTQSAGSSSVAAASTNPTVAQKVADANHLHCPLRTPLPIKLPSHLSLGSLATVTGLVAASKKNGLTVKILGYDEKAGRHRVEFTVDGNTALLRSQNLAQHEDLMATDLLHTSAVSTSKPKTDKISENARDSTQSAGSSSVAAASTNPTVPSTNPISSSTTFSISLGGVRTVSTAAPSALSADSTPSSTERPASTARASSCFGYIFDCNDETEIECLKHHVFGAPSSCLEDMKRRDMTAGTPLFLRNIVRKSITGPFASVGTAGWNLFASLFGGRFPAQVRVKNASAEGIGTLPIRESLLRTVPLARGDRWISPAVAESLSVELVRVATIPKLKSSAKGSAASRSPATAKRPVRGHASKVAPKDPALVSQQRSEWLRKQNYRL